MASYEKFLNQNVKSVQENTKGLMGKGFLVAEIAAIVQADGALNKLKASMKALFNLTIGFKLMFGLSFLTMGKAVRSLVRDTGSLEAALRRLERIQGFQKVFAPLVGGAAAAKQKVAELVLLSERSPFKFESFAEAALSLMRLTKGAFAGTHALRLIGDAAARSGQPIEAVADAVGQAHKEIMAGGMSDGMVDTLREMGVISIAAAQSLRALGSSNANAAAGIRELEAALAASRGGMEEMGDDLATVTMQHERASEELKEKFGAPFTADEVTNVKNMTAAMTALAPTVEFLGVFLAKAFGGLSTFKSWMTKIVAESPMVQTAIKVIVVGIVSLAAVLSVSAIPALWAFTTALMAMIPALAGFGIALKVLVGSTGIGLIVMILATLVVGLYNFANGTRAAARAAEQFRKALKDGNDAVRQQINNIRTLADKQLALAAATARVVDLQNQLNAAISGGADSGKIDDLRSALASAQGDLENVASRKAETLTPNQSAYAADKSRWEVEKKRADLEGKMKPFVAPSAEAAGSAMLRRKALRERNAAEAEILDAGLTAPKTSAVYAETMEQKLNALIQSKSAATAEERDRQRTLAGDVDTGGKDPLVALGEWQRKSVQARAWEGNRVQIESEERESRMSQLGRAGEGGAAIRLKNLDEYAQRFDQAFQLTQDEGRARSMAETGVTESIYDRASSPVSNLQRLGLGDLGGTDPGLDVQKEIKNLMKDAVGYLKAQAEGQPYTPPGGME